MDSQSTKENITVVEMTPADVSDSIVEPTISYMESVSADLLTHSPNLTAIVEGNETGV